MPITRALISVSDKTGLVEFGRFLMRNRVEILSTGGSAKALREAGVTIVEVADHTGFPEIMDGRVKTLHPKIHGGILALREAHGAAMAEHGIAPIDLVAVNLYPFEATVALGAPFDKCIENIDIGGPAMIRSAAKNHGHVTVVVDPADYQSVMDGMAAGGGDTSPALRRRLAGLALARTAAYDAAIANWLAAQAGEELPERLLISASRREVLRYGENPHQNAAIYVGGAPRPGVAGAEQVQGKALSYNNLGDTDAAFELVAEFAEPAVAIIKHANPAGVAIAGSPAEAYRAALAGDPVSAFGGIIALNRPLDGATATLIAELFAEVVIAPGAGDAARAALSPKKNLRLLLTEAMPDPAAPGLVVKSLAGGYLVQGRDGGRITADDLTTVTKRAPSDAELRDLLFAFTVCKHVKSNAIVYARDRATVGVGAGQMSRVDAARIAAWKAAGMAENAGEPHSRAIGSVAASDAFFPFPDGLLTAAEAGVTAVIQPGGSKRDDEIIAAADGAGLAMVMTGMRHFRH